MDEYNLHLSNEDALIKLKAEYEMEKQQQLAKEILEINEDKELTKGEKLIIIEMKTANSLRQKNITFPLHNNSVYEY